MLAFGLRRLKYWNGQLQVTSPELLQCRQCRCHHLLQYYSIINGICIVLIRITTTAFMCSDPTEVVCNVPLCWSVCLFVCLLVCLSICVSVCLCVGLLACLLACLLALFVCWFVYLFCFVVFCLFVCLLACLCVRECRLRPAART